MAGHTALIQAEDLRQFEAHFVGLGQLVAKFMTFVYILSSLK